MPLWHAIRVGLWLESVTMTNYHPWAKPVFRPHQNYKVTGQLTEL